MDSLFVGCTAHECGKQSRETRDHLDDLADGVAEWRLRNPSKPELSLFEEVLQFIREFKEPKLAQQLSTYDNARERDRTYLRLMRSERILLKDSVRFCVPNLFWQYVSVVDHGEVPWARASTVARDPGLEVVQWTPVTTVNHPFARGSVSFRMKRNKLSSFPCGDGILRKPPQRRTQPVFPHSTTKPSAMHPRF